MVGSAADARQDPDSWNVHRLHLGELLPEGVVIAAARPYHGRVSRTFVSPDFANWSHSSAIQFVRSPQHHLLGPGKSRIGEQTHEGISVWNRGNVLVGVSGMWHGTQEWKDLTIDLGFVVSNDGIRFREPSMVRVWWRIFFSRKY